MQGSFSVPPCVCVCVFYGKVCFYEESNWLKGTIFGEGAFRGTVYPHPNTDGTRRRNVWEVSGHHCQGEDFSALAAPDSDEATLSYEWTSGGKEGREEKQWGGWDEANFPL